MFIKDVSVIGGGIFGCLCAIELSRLGYEVAIFEKNSDLMLGATLNNQNRLHLGYHYPRDLETARQSALGFELFKNEFEPCILDGFPNFYFISSHDSKVDFGQYKEFCHKANLPFEEVHNLDIGIKNIQGGIRTHEVVYDANVLRHLVLERLGAEKVSIYCESLVTSIVERGGFYSIEFGDKQALNSRAVVNCSYAGHNSFNASLGVPSDTYQFELTVVPIIRWRPTQKIIGVTVMDGPFFTVLPFGHSGNYLLYHVLYSVLGKSKTSSLPELWSDARQVVTKDIAEDSFKKMVKSVADWLPSIEEANFVGYLASPRIVIANAEKSDKRHSIIKRIGNRNCFISVFSGKIDHSTWVSEEVARLVNGCLTV